MDLFIDGLFIGAVFMAGRYSRVIWIICRNLWTMWRKPDVWKASSARHIAEQQKKADARKALSSIRTRLIVIKDATDEKVRNKIVAQAIEIADGAM